MTYVPDGWPLVDSAPRRIAKVMFTAELLKAFATVGWDGDGASCIEGLPEGAKTVGVFHEDPYIVGFYVEHESFAEVRESDEIPTIVVSYQREWGPRDEFRRRLASRAAGNGGGDG